MHVCMWMWEWNGFMTAGRDCTSFHCFIVCILSILQHGQSGIPAVERYRTAALHVAKATRQYSYWAMASPDMYLVVIASAAQEKGDRRQRTSDRVWTRDLHFFVELQPHKLSVPVANPIALCTGRRCVAIWRPLKDLSMPQPTSPAEPITITYCTSLKS